MLGQENYVIEAKKLALRAKAVYPELDDITQILSTFDVYQSVQKVHEEEVDWYKVLGFKPSDADKKRSVAWDLISDKAKRLKYDLKRGIVQVQVNRRTRVNQHFMISWVKYFGDPKEAPPPLERVSPEGEGSFIEELIQCMAHHMDDNILKDLKTNIQARGSFGIDYPQTNLRGYLIWLRDEMQNLHSTYKSWHDTHICS
ncbi:uncharacterized protein LOC127241415 [Andrographis paniculata]|uniref:uncharacterized protein LOC127241415 n=1 Tax=Andrographis paniculata TaxID=175694 RepID=UPI0021E8D642|nr:uncharacterized protein LOC127241415 [Andrographis paniculata]XP_051116409.1 uncharacterized protein LOC127241415 [Andrographis paniculata]